MGEAVAGISVARAVAVRIEVAAGVGVSGGWGEDGGTSVIAIVGGMEGGCFGLVDSITDKTRIIKNMVIVMVSARFLNTILHHFKDY